MPTDLAASSARSRRRTSWLYLVGAIVVEIATTSVLPMADGFTEPVPAAIVTVGYLLSFYLLTHATAYIPLGIAYALWCAIGTVAICVIGVFALHQPMSPMRWLGVLLVVVGVSALNLCLGANVSESDRAEDGMVVEPDVVELETGSRRWTGGNQ